MFALNIVSKNLIKRARRKCIFLKSIVTGDETLSFKYDPQTNAKVLRESLQTLLNRKIAFSKIMREENVDRKFVPQGQNIAVEYYLGICGRESFK